MKLLKLEIKNFKGIAEATFNYQDRNVIEAKNENGKSTQFQAFKWLLGFKIDGVSPTLKYEKNGKVENILIGTPESPCETIVTAIIEHDQKQFTLSKKQKQTWKTPVMEVVENDDMSDEFEITDVEFIADKTQSKMTGFTSQYYYDSLTAISKTLFQSKITALFNDITPTELGWLVDISTFNDDTKTKWEVRRSFLMSKLGLESLNTELANKPCYNLLKPYLIKGNDEIDIQKELKKQKSSIELELASINKAINDYKLRLVQVNAIDFEGLKNKLAETQVEYEKLLVSSTKDIKNDIEAEKQAKLSTLTQKLLVEKSQLNSAIIAKQKYGNELEYKKSGLQITLDNTKKTIERLNDENNDIVLDIDMLSGRTLKENDTICPTCHQKLQNETITIIAKKFEEEKTTKLAILKENLNKNVSIIKEKTEDLAMLSNDIQKLDIAIEQNNGTEIDSSALDTIQEKIDELNRMDTRATTSEAHTEFNNKLALIKNDIAMLNQEIAKETFKTATEEEIKKLMIARKEFNERNSLRAKAKEQLSQFTKDKIDIVNAKINAIFSEDISFKFLDYNLDSTENEYNNTCDCMYKGKLYATQTSSGAKILTDIIIADGLSKLLNVNLPLWVDNAESLTTEIKSPNQVFELRAVKDKVLSDVVRVENYYTLDDCVLRA